MKVNWISATSMATLYPFIIFTALLFWELFCLWKVHVLYQFDDFSNQVSPNSPRVTLQSPAKSSKWCRTLDGVMLIKGIPNTMFTKRATTYHQGEINLTDGKEKYPAGVLTGVGLWKVNMCRRLACSFAASQSQVFELNMYSCSSINR